MTCSYITRVWFGSQLNINIDKSPITNFSDWISYAIEHNEPDITIQIADLTYHIWFDRNQRVFEDKRIPEEDIIHRAANSIHDFHEAHLPQNAKATLACYSGYSSKPKRVTTWKKPTDNLVKMNSDANLQVDGWWGLGTIARDNKGLVLAAATWCAPRFKDVLIAEVLL